jgi:hypothetical protein
MSFCRRALAEVQVSGEMRPRVRIPRRASLRAVLVLVAFSGIGSARPPAGEGTQAAISLIGGGTATAEWPTTALLATGVSQCSATLIGCRTALTAAHCVCSVGGSGDACGLDGTNRLDPNDMVLYLQHAGFLFVDSVEVPPSYEFGVAGDLAVLHLAYPMRGLAPSPINMLTEPLAGETGTIVGFGASEVGGADAGIKRVGSIEVASCTDVPEANYVCWTFDGTQADTCLGDSGGPLFADVGAGLRLAGVHSGGDDVCNVGDNAFDADVFVESLWIQSEAGADLGVASCGDGPQLGDPSVTTDSFTGTVATQATHSFSVPAGTKELRVGLNAALGSPPNDLDLYLKFGAPPTTSDFDCGPQLLGVFEFCTISDPAPGTWHVLVDVLVGGPAEYQVTVAELPANPAPPSLATGDYVLTDFTAWEVMRVDGATGDRSILSSPLRGSGPDLAAPEGVSSGPGGKIVVANVVDRSLLQIDPATGDRTVVSGCVDPACSSQVGSGPAFQGPRFVAFGAAGVILVTDRDAGFNAVLQVDPLTGDRSVVSGCENAVCSSIRGTGPALDTLFGIAVETGGDNDIVVASSYALLRIDPATGDRTVLSGCTDASCTATIGSGPSFGRPEEIEREGPISLLVVDGDRDAPPFRAIFRVDLATGQRTILSGCSDVACSGIIGAGPLFSAGLIGLGFASSGDLLVSDGVQRSLFFVDPVSGDRSVFTGCMDASCTSVAGAGTHFTDPLGIVTVPEPDPRLGLGACCALLAVLAGKCRGSRADRAARPPRS